MNCDQILSRDRCTFSAQHFPIGTRHGRHPVDTQLVRELFCDCNGLHNLPCPTAIALYEVGEASSSYAVAVAGGVNIMHVL